MTTEERESKSAQWRTDNLGNGSAFREHCEFKDAPCNYTGKGWYDRCASCKDNNGFKRKTDDTSKPF